MFNEIPSVIECLGSRLIVILHKPKEAPASENIFSERRLGVLIVVGGGQYRVGSHRQFVLLARYLAGQGFPVMRFDYRGMGDSEGEQISYKHCAPDLAAAIEHFYLQCPALGGVVLWGLCDAATASILYTHKESRVKGLILLNPWSDSKESEAKAYIKHYYASRLLNPDMWRKIFHGRFNFKSSLSDFLSQLKLTFGQPEGVLKKQRAEVLLDDSAPISSCIYEGLLNFKGKVLIILSTGDITARQFNELKNSNEEWKLLMRSLRVSEVVIEGADHTFSNKSWRGEVEHVTGDWLKKLKEEG